MSAPDTNIKKQQQRHKGPLFGIGMALVWGGGLLALFLVYTISQGSDDDIEEPGMIQVME